MVIQSKLATYELHSETNMCYCIVKIKQTDHNYFVKRAVFNVLINVFYISITNI